MFECGRCGAEGHGALLDQATHPFKRWARNRPVAGDCDVPPRDPEEVRVYALLCGACVWDILARARQWYVNHARWIKPKHGGSYSQASIRQGLRPEMAALCLPQGLY